MLERAKELMLRRRKARPTTGTGSGVTRTQRSDSPRGWRFRREARWTAHTTPRLSAEPTQAHQEEPTQEDRRRILRRGRLTRNGRAPRPRRMSKRGKLLNDTSTGERKTPLPHQLSLQGEYLLFYNTSA